MIFNVLREMPIMTTKDYTSNAFAMDTHIFFHDTINVFTSNAFVWSSPTNAACASLHTIVASSNTFLQKNNWYWKKKRENNEKLVFFSSMGLKISLRQGAKWGHVYRRSVNAVCLRI